jgi:peptidoglycan hydrolase-like protein with peptidoglycan-binding domain
MPQMATTVGPGPAAGTPPPTPPPRRGPLHRLGRWRTPAIAAAAVVAVAGVAIGASAIIWRSARLREDDTALAGVDVPPGSTISDARAIAPDGRVTPLEVRGHSLVPTRPLASGERMRVEATVTRPAAVGWITGRTSHLSITLRTPRAQVSRRWLTLRAGAPVTVAFDQPVAGVVATGQDGTRQARRLSHPRTTVQLARPTPAGTVSVAARARAWEKPAPATRVSWFPAGAHPVAVMRPAAGATLQPRGAITITMSRPVAQVLGTTRPQISPAVPGRWTRPDAHTLVFTPTGFGFPLGATVRLAVPDGLDLAGTPDRQVSWQVPGGSEMRLQQLLARLGYLPLGFKAAHPVARTPEAQIAAAITPPKGTFGWRWKSTPQQLRDLWEPGEDTIMTRGALMAFERDHDLTTDGLAGPQVWQALLQATVHPTPVTPDYSYVMVRRDGQSLALWHDGKVIITTPVNTGVAAAPTDPGTFAVFEHLRSTTMSGTNPDGSHYDDPGVPWVSYFNGGDALHGFPRGTYGVPQSVGCVELPIDTAGKVWPYTDVGTLVTVS